MHLLIDGDVIVYRIGFASQKKDKETGEIVPDPESFALHSCKLFITDILKETGCTSYKLFLTGKDNFRHKVRSDYKANRKGAEKPVHYNLIREYMQQHFNAQVVHGMEADDAMALLQTDDTCIATIDKDLLMVPGLHYNFQKHEFTEVSEDEGTRFFFEQMLTGDKVDNITGIRGIGPVKAKRLLEETPREDWEDMVLQKYEEEFTPDGFQRAIENSMLLWMLQRNRSMPMEFRNEATEATEAIGAETQTEGGASVPEETTGEAGG